MLFSPPARVEQDELIDSLEPDDADFAAAFRDIGRINRYLGGTRATLNALVPLVRQLPEESSTRPIRVLDIATGSADVPRSIIQATRRGRLGIGRRIEIVAVDNHAKVLDFAAQQTPANAYPEIQITSADAFALPFADNSFDFALCSLSFHHFDPARCVCLLQEMDRVTKCGFIVNDLIRDHVAYVLIWLLSRVMGMNYLVRNDGPLSVLRAYTFAEYVQMVQAAQLTGSTRVQRIPLYRAIIVCDKEKAAGV